MKTIEIIRWCAIGTVSAMLVASCVQRQPAVTPTPIPVDTDGDPIVRPEPLSAYGNHSPYRVLGETYSVLPSSRGYREKGIASWYGEPFHGRPTSSMEIFDMNLPSAAHKTLPLPTYARVTNIDNGRAITVRINDRGPFKPGRIIDLSYAAAVKLDMVQSGIANVEVTALVPEGLEVDRPLVVSREHLFVQAGVFSDRANALSLINRLRTLENLPPAHMVSNDDVHRVRIGPVVHALEADAIVAEMTIEGFERPVIIFE